MALKWIFYAIIIGVVVWILFAIRIVFAIKERMRKKERETFEKRDN